MNARAAIVVWIAACGHPVAPAPSPDPLWACAELVSGDGGGHLPLPARALVATGGARALAALDDGGLAEIDLARGEPMRVAPAAIDGEIAAMARLRDGRVLAVGAGRDSERAWWIDPRTLAVRAVDVAGAAGGDSVREAGGVAASPDGKAIAITGVRLPLALRDPRDLSITRVLSPERNWSHPVFVDEYLVAAHHDAMIAFDLGTGRPLKPWLSTIGFASPDGLALMHPPDVIHLELRDLHDPDARVALASADPVDVAWSPDGQHVIVIDADRAVAYDIPGGDSHAIAVPGTRSRAVFGADGKHLVITAAGALWRVDPASGRADGPRGPSVGAIAFVAPTAGGLIGASDRWRAIDRDGVTASGGWRGVGGSFALAPGGARVIATSTAGGEAFVEAWDVASGRSLVSAVADDGVVAADIDDAGGITVATPDGIERLGADGRDVVLASARWAPPIALAGERAVFGRAGAIVVTDLAATRALATAAAFGCDGAAWVRLSRDGARLAIVVDDRVAIYDVAGDRLIATARLPAPIRALALDARGVIAATRDRLIRWDPRAGTATAIAMPAAVTAIGVDGDRVALGFGDGRAGVWTAAALDAVAHPTAMLAAGPPPARCPGDPLAPVADEEANRPRIGRLHGP